MITRVFDNDSRYTCISLLSPESPPCTWSSWSPMCGCIILSGTVLYILRLQGSPINVNKIGGIIFYSSTTSSAQGETLPLNRYMYMYNSIFSKKYINYDVSFFFLIDYFFYIANFIYDILIDCFYIAHFIYDILINFFLYCKFYLCYFSACPGRGFQLV